MRHTTTLIKPKIVQAPDAEPVAAEVIAQSIADIAAGMRKLEQSRLKRDSIITLLHHTTKVSRKDITYVLNALSMLEQTHLKPLPK